LASISGNRKLQQNGNLYDAAQNADDILAVSSALDLLARQLIKIGSDLRLLNSGPVGGLKEIDLPATQAGSSIMPGKVNPVIPEYAMQLAMQATGLHQASATALAHAELDLNIWESLITCNTLDMTDLLATAMMSLADAAIEGLEVIPANNQKHLESPIRRWTELAKDSGYSEAVKQLRQSLNKDAEGS
jgi:fumarate hydratase class II